MSEEKIQEPGPTTGEGKDDEVGSLEAPLHVKLAAAALALAGTFTAMIGAQLLLSSAGGLPTLAKVIVSASLIVGLGAIGTSMAVVKGRTWGAVLGMVEAVLIAGLVWAPVYYGFVAFSMFGGAFCGVLSIALLAVSIPACLQITKNHKKLMIL